MPAFLAMGLHPKLPMESIKDETLWERIKHLVTNMPLFRENVLERILLKQNESTWTSRFQIGDQVLLQRSGQPKSLRPKWDGLFVIVKIAGHGTYYILRDHDRTDVVHGDRLRLYQS